jgi:hypothetical protein
VLVQDVKIENVRRVGCSDHVDGIQIWGANHVTFRNMNLVAPMPTLTVIARPGMAGGKAYPLTDIRFEGGHYLGALGGAHLIHTVHYACPGIISRSTPKNTAIRNCRINKICRPTIEASCISSVKSYKAIGTDHSLSINTIVKTKWKREIKNSAIIVVII